MKIQKKRGQHGRSMLEMLGVLAIIGILSVAALLGFKSALDKNKANKIVSDVQLVALTLDTDQVLYPMPAPSDEKETQDLLLSLTSGYHLVYQKKTPQSFVVKVDGVSESVCRKLVDMKPSVSYKLSVNDDAGCTPNENNALMYWMNIPLQAVGTEPGTDTPGSGEDLCKDIDCGPHGTCQEGYCLCNNGWFGETCSENNFKTCPNGTICPDGKLCVHTATQPNTCVPCYGPGEPMCITYDENGYCTAVTCQYDCEWTVIDSTGQCCPTGQKAFCQKADASGKCLSVGCYEEKCTLWCASYAGDVCLETKGNGCSVSCGVPVRFDDVGYCCPEGARAYCTSYNDDNKCQNIACTMSVDCFPARIDKAAGCCPMEDDGACKERMDNEKCTLLFCKSQCSGIMNTYDDVTSCCSSWNPPFCQLYSSISGKCIQTGCSVWGECVPARFDNVGGCCPATGSYSKPYCYQYDAQGKCSGVSCKAP